MKFNIKRVLCFFGYHKMIIGIGWARDNRYDICKNCNYNIWVEDKEGCDKITQMVESQTKTLISD